MTVFDSLIESSSRDATDYAIAAETIPVIDLRGIGRPTLWVAEGCPGELDKMPELL